MELTRYDRERLGQLLGAPVLAGHAVLAGYWAKGLLSLPMEAGGLFLGPVVGFPLASASLMLLVGAGLFLTGRVRLQGVACLVACLAFDVLAAMSGYGGAWPVAGAVLAALSLTSLATLVQVRLDGPHARDQLFFVVLFALLGLLAVVFVLGTA